jgi:hypothetical protein
VTEEETKKNTGDEGMIGRMGGVRKGQERMTRRDREKQRGKG